MQKESAYPKIQELVAHLANYQTIDSPTSLLIKKTMLNDSICLLSLFGTQVDAYITYALMFRANDPKSYADKITREVFTQIFPPEFKPQFNQFVSITTSLALARFDALNQPNVQLPDAIKRIKQNQEDFMLHEIDAVIFVKSTTIQEKWLEIKMFTCPNQASYILEKHLQPKPLKEYFGLNDYLGLMGFSLPYTEKNVPFVYERDFHQRIPTLASAWMVHLILCDRGICYDSRPATEIGPWLLEAIRKDLTNFNEKLGLNNQNCYFKLTENFVKVVKMEQIIEEYKTEVEQLRKETEQALKKEEQALKKEEQERKEKEQALKRIAELEKKIQELQKPRKK